MPSTRKFSWTVIRISVRDWGEISILQAGESKQTSVAHRQPTKKQEVPTSRSIWVIKHQYGHPKDIRAIPQKIPQAYLLLHDICLVPLYISDVLQLLPLLSTPGIYRLQHLPNRLLTHTLEYVSNHLYAAATSESNLGMRTRHESALAFSTPNPLNKVNEAWIPGSVYAILALGPILKFRERIFHYPILNLSHPYSFYYPTVLR